MTTLDPKQMETHLKELGFSLEILSGPTGHVSKDWPCIQFTVRLLFNSKRVLDTDYSLGVGHVHPKQHRNMSTNFLGLTMHEESLLMAWQSKPYANFQNKELWATLAAKLARREKLAPSLPEVLHSLLLDGSAHFDHQSFEDWAGEFGYDADSREAERIYRLCDDIGRKLAHSIPKTTLEDAQGILKNL